MNKLFIDNPYIVHDHCMHTGIYFKLKTKKVYDTCNIHGLIKFRAR